MSNWIDEFNVSILLSGNLIVEAQEDSSDLGSYQQIELTGECGLKSDFNVSTTLHQFH